LSAVVVTQSGSPRCIPAEELGPVAEDIYGSDRVVVTASLPDALDQAVSLAESDGDLAGAGVLVTGSVTLVGEARTLLTRPPRTPRPPQPPPLPPAQPPSSPDS
jgi:dihydrofolate synthase/folylpolyglutamate synthase